MHIQEPQSDEVRTRLCEGSTWLSRLATILTLAALTFHVVSVSTSHWMAGSIRGSPVAHTGLWQECSLFQLFSVHEHWVCLSYEAVHHQDTAPPFLKASQAFAVLGLVGQVACTVMLFVFTLLPKLTIRKPLMLAAVATSLASGFFVLVALGVFPSHFPKEDLQAPPFTVTWSVSWCFGLDFLSVLASIAAPALLLWDLRTKYYNFSDTSV